MNKEEWEQWLESLIHKKSLAQQLLEKAEEEEAAEKKDRKAS